MRPPDAFFRVPTPLTRREHEELVHRMDVLEHKLESLLVGFKDESREIDERLRKLENGD